MGQTAKRYLRMMLERTLNNLSADEWHGLFLPGRHGSVLTSHRVAVITSRVRAVAALFAILTPAWIVIDIAVFHWPFWPQLALLRLAASIAFGILAYTSGSCTSIDRAHRELAFLLGIPILFFIASHFLLSTQMLQGAAETVATGYAFLPFVIVAGLSVFPLTAVEGLVCALPVLAVEVGVAAFQLDGLPWSTHLGMAWLLLLIAVVASLAGMSQLDFMMALVRQATRDTLTNCFTRTTGEGLLEIQFKIAQRKNAPLVLVFADLDNFKVINDVHGHDAGDRALAQASKALRRALRVSDIQVRWGGEEFVVMMPDTDRHTAIAVIERLRAAGLGMRPDGQPMTASFGIAEYPGDNAKNWRELVEIADRRMYAAKELGKNRLIGDSQEFYPPGIAVQRAD
ncbi:MAG: diguanylate cyclase [Sulfuricella sp.]|nr:diguanylate cyclase [Sulfuricella sp.]